MRKKLVKQRAGYKATLKEQKRVYSKKQYKLIFEIQEKVIREFNKQIEKLEKEMQEIILKNKQLKLNFYLLNSIKGVGEKTAITMLIFTDNFTKFESSRKFASYCGIAPFPHISGSSVRGKNKVSHLANKSIKSILNMCAINAIQYNPEIKAFYERRIKKGKNKMSTINIIRNKLISRMFAIIKRKTPYVDTMKFAA
ncbi:transposase [Aureivirga sp. CE67]|uniref:transposase n=1 Tax=Aureivirga sp. CE67 TaxID=1788983 RepID=UPI001E4A4172|nr:transposase [Aureivirga sp. CE67]